MKGGDLSQYYRVYTPVDVPLRFCHDGFYRLAAKCECVSCGRAFMQVVRCHRFTVQRSALATPRLTKRPDPKDEQIISTFMLKACDHGCGCSNKDNFDQHGQPRFNEVIKVKGLTCLHGPEESCPTCIEKAAPYRGLKFAPHLHSRTCPVGLMVRTGPMLLAGFQANRPLGRA